MNVTRTVELNEEEKKAVQMTLGLCDEIADLCNDTPMMNVFGYFIRESELVGDYDYIVDNIVNLGDI